VGITLDRVGLYIGGFSRSSPGMMREVSWWDTDTLIKRRLVVPDLEKGECTFFIKLEQKIARKLIFYY
jgi:hypothetical protein